MGKGGKGRSTGLLRVGAFNTSSKLWTGADCGADCALLWGVTIRAPVRGFGGGGGLGADAGAETERGGGCANRSKFEATVRVWRSGFNISRIPVSWSTVIVGLKAINREANDWAAVGAAGGGVPPGGGALAGWLTTCGGTTAAATGGGMATWGGGNHKWWEVGVCRRRRRGSSRLGSWACHLYLVKGKTSITN